MFKSLTFFLVFFFTSTIALSARDIDLNSLASEAAKQNKHLLVWLHKTDCSYCEAMREFTLEDEAVAADLKEAFVFVHINVLEEDKITFGTFVGNGKSFAKRVGYSFYPSSVFLDGNANIVFAAPGYIEERDFKVMLKFVSSDSYKKMGYDCFRRQEEKQ